MARHLRGRTAAVALAVIAAGMVPASSASADTVPTDILIPATMRTTPGYGSFMSAGTAGFLHRSTDVSNPGLDWTTYDGVTRRVEGGDDRESYAPIEYYGADSDIVALPPKDGVGSVVALRNMATGRSWTIAIPGGLKYDMTLGDTVVAYRPTANNGPLTEFHLLREENGVTTDRVVTGLPEGAFFYGAGQGSAEGFLLMLHLPGETYVKHAWVDLTTARGELLPANTYTPVVVDGYVAVTGGDGLRLYEQGKFDAPARVIKHPGSSAKILGVSGESLIVGRRDPAYGKPTMYAAQWRVSAVPFDGSPARELLARAIADKVVILPGNGLVIMGGASALDYGFNAITAQGTGEAHAVRLHDIEPVPMAVQRLVVDGGQVTTVEWGDRRSALYTRDLTSTAPGYGSRIDRGGLQGWFSSCGSGGTFCPDLVPTGDGRLVYADSTAAGGGAFSVVSKGGETPGTQWPSDLTGVGSAEPYYEPEVLGASGSLALVSGQPAGGVRELRVMDLDRGTVVRKEPYAIAALWGTTLWTASPTGVSGKLTVTARHARTGAKLTAVTVGTSCARPNKLEAVGEWLYWNCSPADAASQPAGVLNVRTGKNTPLPGHAAAQLGHGVVVMDGARYEVHTGTAVGRKLDGWNADLDARTGDIAMGSSSIRVLRPGFPAASLASPYSAVTATAETDSTPVAWRGEWWLSEPAASWTVTVRGKATGKTVATRSGGASEYSLATSWDGRAADGSYLPNGAYTWTLSARPADGAGANLVKSGTIRLTGGSAVRRDHTSDGNGDALTMNSSGSFTFQRGDGAGKFAGKTSGSGWSTSTLAVPFGDLNNDRCNDVLVRMTDGSLRGYKPGCAKALTPTTAYTKLGTGFQAYKTLTSPGDLTGDGRADLLGWRTSTGDVYLFAAKSDGTLAAGKKIRTHWTYSKIMGVGDLNGDGYGELLAKDKSNELWRYDGTASGQFKARVLLAKDWGTSYNAIVGAGDITGDGKADLIARDTSGRLFRNNGYGNGKFGARTLIATGWGVYKGMY